MWGSFWAACGNRLLFQPARCSLFVAGSGLAGGGAGNRPARAGADRPAGTLAGGLDLPGGVAGS